MESKHAKLIDEATLLRWFKGDQEAVRFLLMVYQVMHTWDDFVDKDPLTEKEVNESFAIALIGMNRNQFYKAFNSDIQPVILFILNQWLESNDLEKNEDGRNMAYVLRALCAGLVPHMAYIIGGWEHMREVSKEVWEIMKKLESLEEYKEEFNA